MGLGDTLVSSVYGVKTAITCLEKLCCVFCRKSKKINQ